MGETGNRNNVRERFLQKCVVEKTPVIAIMRNGFQMRGTVVEFDDGVVIVDVNGVQKMLFSASLSTIEPFVPRQHYVDAPWGRTREFLTTNT